ncbi:hypothetical protein FB451DRAFT_1187862 [Mycena latifolia]|nr:hypothetical protein FB451DRAFT_1187862 [Mycena latifolia]
MNGLAVVFLDLFGPESWGIPNACTGVRPGDCGHWFGSMDERKRVTSPRRVFTETIHAADSRRRERTTYLFSMVNPHQGTHLTRKFEEKRKHDCSADCGELLQRTSKLFAMFQTEHCMLNASLKRLKSGGRIQIDGGEGERGRHGKMGMLGSILLCWACDVEDAFETGARRQHSGRGTSSCRKVWLGGHPADCCVVLSGTQTTRGRSRGVTSIEPNDCYGPEQPYGRRRQKQSAMENLGLCTKFQHRYGREAEEASSQMALGAVTLGQTQPMYGGRPRTGAGELRYNRALARAAVWAVGVDGIHVHIHGRRFDEDDVRDDDKWHTDRRADVAEEVRMRLMQREYGECDDELHTRRRDRLGARRMRGAAAMMSCLIFSFYSLLLAAMDFAARVVVVRRERPTLVESKARVIDFSARSVGTIPHDSFCASISVDNLLCASFKQDSLCAVELHIGSMAVGPHLHPIIWKDTRLTRDQALVVFSPDSVAAQALLEDRIMELFQFTRIQLS